MHQVVPPLNAATCCRAEIMKGILGIAALIVSSQWLFGGAIGKLTAIASGIVALMPFISFFTIGGRLVYDRRVSNPKVTTIFGLQFCICIAYSFPYNTNNEEIIILYAALGCILVIVSIFLMVLSKMNGRSRF